MGLGFGLVRGAVRVMSQAETLFETAFGSYQLTRLPARRRELLRAWDAADEYLLDTVAEEVKPGTQSRILARKFHRPTGNRPLFVA